MSQQTKIIEVAIEAFRTKGIKSVTMDSIAQTAGVSKRTIYELFKDKDTLVVQALGQMIIQQNQEFVEILGNTENVIEALFNILEREALRRTEMSPSLVDDIKKYFHLVNAEFFSDHEKMCEYSPSFTFLQKGIDQGIFRKDLKLEFVDNFLHEIIGLIHTSNRIRQLNPSKDDFVHNIFMPYIRGLCTEKGLKLMKKYFDVNQSSN